MELSLPISELGRLTVRYGSSATVATEQTDQLAVVRTWPQLGLDINHGHTCADEVNRL